jgi:hypothetical protein
MEAKPRPCITCTWTYGLLFCAKFTSVEPAAAAPVAGVTDDRLEATDTAAEECLELNRLGVVTESELTPFVSCVAEEIGKRWTAARPIPDDVCALLPLKLEDEMAEEDEKECKVGLTARQ